MSYWQTQDAPRWECSLVADDLSNLIERKLHYMNTLTNKPQAYKAVQEEINLLNRALSIVKCNDSVITQIILREFGKVLVQAVEKQCNDLVVVVPLNDRYKDKPKVAIYNSSAFRPDIVYTNERGEVDMDSQPNQILVHRLAYKCSNIDCIGDIVPEIVRVNPKIDL